MSGTDDTSPPLSAAGSLGSAGGVSSAAASLGGDASSARAADGEPGEPDQPLISAVAPRPPRPRGAAEWIEALQLEPHPEGGFFRETYRAGTTVQASSHPEPRSASTAIYFLITSEQPATRLHRLRSDEVFHLYEGGPLQVLVLRPNGSSEAPVLGLDIASGQRPQIVIPAGSWFGTKLSDGVDHCLIGCTVAPGFDFDDFELATGTQLKARHPTRAALIEAMLPAASASKG